MLASLRAFLTALILSAVVGSLALCLPPSLSLLSAMAAAILVAFPIIWILLDAAGPPKGRLATALAHLGGWLLAPVLSSTGQILVALPATLLWPIGNLFLTPFLTGNIWSWAARTFLAALLVVLYWATELALSLRARQAEAKPPAEPPAWPEAPDAPARRTPLRVGPTPTEHEILRRLDALERAVTLLSNQTSDMAVWLASQDLRATSQPLRAYEPETVPAAEIVDQDEKEQDSEAEKPSVLSRPEKAPGGGNVLDLFHR